MVRVSVPCAGWAKRTIPASTASAAEISDHQKPGISRAQKVNARPAIPLIRNTHPTRMVRAREGIAHFRRQLGIVVGHRNLPYRLDDPASSQNDALLLRRENRATRGVEGRVQHSHPS